ncbi:DMT family transporter [bacterium]|nr:MAG: DMT family transporter [bacterium]
MLQTLVVILIGLIGGVAVGFQGPIAGAMGQRIGGTASSLIVHVGGAVISALLLAFRHGENIQAWKSLPWYMLIAGIFGVILYQTINVTLPRLGSTVMVMLIIIGQLGIGVLIDHFGWLGVAVHPISLNRVIGLLLLLAGGFFISR